MKNKFIIIPEHKNEKGEVVKAYARRRSKLSKDEINIITGKFRELSDKVKNHENRCITGVTRLK